jgi:drug/metabolite transporter (DMT)-like permease
VTGVVFVALLAAAVLHAAWNAIAKAIPDHRVTAGLLGAAGLVPAAAGVVVLPVPDPGAWPYLGASSVPSSGYLLLLAYAYRRGEFGQVYPLARGLPPVLVTMLAFGVLGERLTLGQFAGVIVICLALGALVFAGGLPRAGHGFGLAAAAGAMIATYTIIDGIGVRESGHALSYAAWRILLEGLLVLAVSRVIVGAGFWRAARTSARLGLSGGLLAVAAFATVLWAQSQAPLALVSAVRESSLLFASVISVLVFGERFTMTRLVATVTAVAGIVLVQAT